MTDPAEPALPQFNLSEKKKSKTKKAKAKKQIIEQTTKAIGDDAPATGAPALATGDSPANGSPTLVNEDEDYSYDVLLRRLYEQVEKGKAKPPPSNRPPLEPPIALRFGGARTGIFYTRQQNLRIVYNFSSCL